MSLPGRWVLLLFLLPQTIFWSTSRYTDVSDDPRPLSSVGDVCADGQFDGRGVGPSILIVMPQSSSSSTIVDNLFCSSTVKASFLLLLLFFALDLVLKE